MYAEIFPIPELHTEGTLIGTDGQTKMSKSLNNAIFLSDDSETVVKKVMSMFTDPNRITASTPGQVENNPVFIYHRAFNPDKAEVLDLEERYKRGKVGDVEVKLKLAHALNEFLDPIREQRSTYAKDTGLVNDILTQGTRQAHTLAQDTISQVRESMGITNYLFTEVKQIYQPYPIEKSTPTHGLALV
jgi:tryptophanyl-tRNA synthetase